MSSIVVYVEHQDGTPKRASLEALGAARAVNDAVVAVVSGAGAGPVAAATGSAGAAKAIVLTGTETFSPDAIAAGLTAIVRDAGASAFLCSATSTGRELAPRVAAGLDSNLFSDCTGFADVDGEIHVTRPWLAGKLIATLRSTAPVLCATLRRNIFTPFAGAGTAEVSEVAAPAEAKVTLTGVAAKEAGQLDVSEAPIVISGGRGMKAAEHFKLIEDLAAAFGTAAVGASRAVVDAGWRPHAEQVGQTGKTVSPQLYVAIGISGAIQHLAGMKTAKVIVAINKDADAPIFKVADYGIVGDAFEVVPALTAAVARIRAEG